MAVRRTRASAVSSAAISSVQQELAARVAEADWLKAHYERHLREALARVESLRAQSPVAAPQPVQQPTASAVEAELRQLRHEVERMRLAERRYLDRIDELKEALSVSGERG